MKDTEAEQGCPAVCRFPPVAPPAPQVWCTPSSLAQGPRCKGTGQETWRPGLRRARPPPRAVDAGWVTDAHSLTFLAFICPAGPFTPLSPSEREEAAGSARQVAL